ncbi:hypothetical protein CVT24_005990 [Panaeolus cyanescens]|uniref:DNA-directed DNA polymerase n=1 Tax=Panaeolus cyanescens TaxID=181874 RepID=A0A409V8W0_9AGAR|nr:hypothetical protein CVT24_005990 [Panaeolus cyanescens]
MPQKRFAPTSWDSDQSSSSNTSGPSATSTRATPSKRPKLGPHYYNPAPSDRPIKVFLIQAKLSEQEVTNVYRIIDEHSLGDDANDGALNLQYCNNPADADIILTKISMRKRLERHIPWQLAEKTAVVCPGWLMQSVKAKQPLPCGDFVVIKELHGDTIEHCPHDCGTGNPGRIQLPSSPTASSSEQDDSVNGFIPPIVKPTEPKVFDNWWARYSCQRASPLVCPNQNLAEELHILCRSRELEGLGINALAYERAISIIKSYPELITKETFSRDVMELPGIGEKIQSKIHEFLKNGFIEESRVIRQSERYQAITLFASIYGIGPANARKLYDIGLRTFEDLERYYDIRVGGDLKAIEPNMVTPNGKKIPPSTKIPEITVKVGIALRNELDAPIPREEVEAIYCEVMAQLNILEPGCEATIVGGYRRGKPRSNDVDIVITHPTKAKGLCKRFAQHLYQAGLVTHILHLSGFHAHDALRTEHWDSLEKALTVFILPEGTKFKRTHRRLDLIFAMPEAYWTAVIGWSGSKMFERDLRLYAKEEKYVDSAYRIESLSKSHLRRGLKFDSSGLTRRRDSLLYVPRSEEEVFQILGLDWIDPTMRNADA